MSLPWNVNASMGGAGVNYQIQRSLRFRASASAYLSRTPASNGSQTKWTVSFWYKPGRFGSQQPIITSYTTVNNYALIGFSLNAYINANDTLKFYVASSGTTQLALETTAVYRDPSAWYHVVVAVDTTQATSTNRVLIYVNGVQVTSFSTATYPALNASLVLFNTTNPQQIGALATGTYGYYDGYMAEFNWIDGQQLTPASFGYNDPVTGVWQPAPFKGTYGANGFYLPFTDIATTSGSNFGLGRDYSGNSNYWNTNNISVTSGATYDSMIDSPTNFSDGSGIYNRGNYCTLSPIDYQTAAPTNGNLTLTNGFARATVGIPSSGKWYWENTIGSSSNNSCGLSPASSSLSDANGGSGFYAYYLNGQKYTAGTASAYGASYTSGDVISVAVDADAGTVTFYKNNVSQGVAFSGLNFANPWLPLARPITTATTDINFGQRPFTYTPPTGFKALNTFNLPTPTIPNGAAYMAATLWTGTGSSRSISNSVNGLSFQPDFIWIKDRSTASAHALTNSVVGTTKYLESNTTASETTDTTSVTAINSDGFSLGAGTATYYTNRSGDSFVGWQWKAGAGTTSTNTSGSITSTVSVSAQSGFSIATYTGTGANATVGHGLGVTPSMYIIKRRNTTGNWPTFHTSITASNVLYLNVTDAQAAYSNVFNATNPTSTVFSIGTSTDTNASGGTYVAYCFAAVRGYSAFGSYTGNGSTDGPFVYTGFRPRFILLKNASAAGTVWLIFDTSRNTYNVANLTLQPESSAAEVTSGGWDIDILSNGFKPRNSGTSSDNGSGNTIIYAAFAENPFNYSRAR